MDDTFKKGGIIETGLVDTGITISDGTINSFKKDGYIESGLIDTGNVIKYGSIKHGQTIKGGLDVAYNFIERDWLGGDDSITTTDAAELDIYSDKYNLLDRFLYGGLLSGAIVLPTNLFKILFTIIFPPLGTILNIIDKYILATFPWITWETLRRLFQIDNLNKIIYTLVLTSMFYIPGLVYALAHLTTNTPNVKGVVRCDPDTGKCIEIIQ